MVCKVLFLFLISLLCLNANESSSNTQIKEINKELDELKKTMPNNELLNYKIIQLQTKEEKLEELEKKITSFIDIYQTKVKELETKENQQISYYQKFIDSNNSIYSNMLVAIGIIFTLITLTIAFIIESKASNKIKDLNKQLNIIDEIIKDQTNRLSKFINTDFETFNNVDEKILDIVTSELSKIKNENKTAKDWFLLALENQKNGNKEEAEKLYRKVIEVDDKYSFAYNNLAVLLDEKGNKEEAEKLYRKAIELDNK